MRGALAGRLLAACFGAGVDSTAMLVALKLADLRPDIITFADLSAEKPETLNHLHRMNAVLVEWGWESVTVCRKETLPGTGYADLYGNCMANETLPSLAFGLKSCSAKWKRIPQDQLIKGVKSGPNACPPHPIWIEAGRRGERIVKLIGYDCGRADIRRSRNLAVADAQFRLRLSAADARMGSRSLHPDHHRDARHGDGANQIGLLLLPGVEDLGAVLAGGLPSRPA
ncbi:hypothetical protein [Mesorhizobium sp.]|uniref:hypothetical protein n=1 Tax=Mesorhizobium sp. TaxID=1871066 RepID=UPI0025E019F5|nr:hypothetical protein [Mesorhizobium sp.]